MSASKLNRDSVQIVSRGMQVLRAFRSDQARLGNAELVRRTGLPKASVSRITGTLVQLGFLRRPPGSREFELDRGSLAIGHAFLASSELLRAAKGTMQELADRLEVSVALAVGNELDMLYVGYCTSHSVGTLRLGVGTLLPIGTTSIGNAFLWAQPREERARLMVAMQHVAGPRWDGMALEIEASFAELERTGTCCVVGRCQRDAYAVALPIRLGRQKVIMGLSCGKAELRPNMDLERRRINPALKEAALELEARLAGFEGPI